MLMAVSQIATCIFPIFPNSAFGSIEYQRDIQLLLLMLEAMSVGDERLEYTGSSLLGTSGKGNTVIHSATTLTILPQDFYQVLESKVSQAIHLP
ncbi:hypothetical protein ACOSP7_011565 [Xanthoceras sorbifolium]